MSQLTPDEVTHLANLARLTLSDEEQTNFAQDLPKIVDFVEQLQNLKVEKHSDATNLMPLEQMRDDVVNSDQLSLEQLEKLAPAWTDGQLEVPAVFGEENV